MRIVKPSAELLSITPNAAQLIELAGRTCYKSEAKITDDSAAVFIKKVMERGHLSVIEHASATFRFVTDRGVTHEMVRHRLAAYSQESTRYCNYGLPEHGDGLTFIQPPAKKRHVICTWMHACESAERDYLSMVDSGIAPQIARSVLPNCLKTEIVMTCNFREWLHVFKLRTSAAAHPQIREIMLLAEDIMKHECPEVFGEK